MQFLLNLSVYSLITVRLSPAATHTLNYMIYKNGQQGPRGCKRRTPTRWTGHKVLACLCNMGASKGRRLAQDSSLQIITMFMPVDTFSHTRTPFILYS